MKNLRRILPFVICISIIAFMPFAYKKTNEKQDFIVTTPKHKYVLTLWNIDVFEGGVGSRGDFLSGVSLDFKNSGNIVMVINHTKESALNAIKSGSFPDMISYGVGVDFVCKYAKALPQISFLGGEYGDKIYAYPWCAGGYFIITKNEDNQPIERLFVSQNDFNMPFGSIYFGKIEAKEIIYKKPIDAYVSFLSASNSDALLGTQRDIKRLEQRGVSFVASPIRAFSDLVQYVSVTTQDKSRFLECVEFIEYLISEKSQKKLTKIGMTSVFFDVYTDGALDGLDFSQVEYTVSPFTSADAIARINGDIHGGNITNNSLLDFKNMLKRL